jgi:hypothetical protein
VSVSVVPCVNTPNRAKAIIMIVRVTMLLGLFCITSPALSDAGPQGAHGYQPTVGQPHSDFVLPNIETGEPVSLSQYRGQKVLLIHFASW